MSLHLDRLTLSHFRSHLRAGMVLDGRPVALFGPNGAGKTNVLEAVSLLSPGRGLRRARPDDIARAPENLGWKITAALTTPDAQHEITTWAEAGQSRQTRIDGKAAPQTALGALAAVVWLTPAMDRLWTEGAEGRRRYLDRMALSFFPGHADAVLSYEKAMRDRNRLLRDQVRDAAWYAALESQMAQAGAVLSANRTAALDRLARATEDAATAFPTADLALTGPDGEGLLPQSAPDIATALAESRRRDLAAGRTLTGPHRTDLTAVYRAKGVAAAQASTGEQKALLISLILANARALHQDRGAPPLLLLDEVSAHLDADRRAALYDELTVLGAQAWMTGTEPGLFSDLGPRAQMFTVTETGGTSSITERPMP
ncbi:DNA replication/repair protein RecF [Roseicitreum antarcticum]|uniref:DNA replication and repair protein RecF n=1 Tax=Roseicitreum antarcticum TaxID=564137 RepID=A0A1H2XBA4_9RHOB|nr:DNA replication/repair protein RecF [Roseicitreum antarcticum]SDW89559.1 DNA replication and repair protein RecF [Roseicitreum antarcticum]